MYRVIKGNGLMTAALLGVIAGIGGLAVVGPPLHTAGSGYRRPAAWQRRDTDLAREITEHNAAVDRRKADKRLAKSKR